MLNVMLIDDHPMLNYGLASCLEETGRFRVCGQAKSLAEALQLIEDSPMFPALVILDVMLGEENGLEFLSFLETYCQEGKKPRPPVLICSVLEDPFRIRTALKMGASGYVSKTSSKAELLNAIDTVLSGKAYVSAKHHSTLEESSGLHSQFTRRELEILNHVKQNKSNQEIAAILKISLRTVENHISNIYFKTGLETRLELLKL